MPQIPLILILDYFGKGEGDENNLGWKKLEESIICVLRSVGIVRATVRDPNEIFGQNQIPGKCMSVMYPVRYW